MVFDVPPAPGPPPVVAPAPAQPAPITAAPAPPVPTPAAPPPDHYGYFSENDLAPKHAVFTLHSATLGDAADHAAMWLGMGDYKHSWLQGGVEQEYGDAQPYLYIEAGHNGQQIHFERFPIAYGAPVYVTLVPHVDTGHWSIIVNGHSFGSIPIILVSIFGIVGPGNLLVLP